MVEVARCHECGRLPSLASLMTAPPKYRVRCCSEQTRAHRDMIDAYGEWRELALTFDERSRKARAAAYAKGAG